MPNKFDPVSPLTPLYSLRVAGTLPSFGDADVRKTSLDGRTFDVANKRYSVYDNPGYQRTIFGQFLNVVEKDTGWRSAKFVTSACALAEEAIGPLPEGMKVVSKTCLTYWTFSSVFKFPLKIRDAVETSQELAKADSEVCGKEAYFRKIVETVQDWLSAIAMTGYGLSSIAACFSSVSSLAAKASRILKDVIADTADAGSEGIDVYESGTTAAEALTVANDASLSPETKQHFLETARYHMLKVAKAICSLVGYALGVILLVTGAPLIPALVTLTISLAANIFAISGSLYKEGMQWQPTEFSNPAHVTSLA